MDGAVYANFMYNNQDDELHTISIGEILEEMKKEEAKFYKELERVDSFIKTMDNKYGQPANIRRNEETIKRIVQIKRIEEEREEERKRKEDGWKDEFKTFEKEQDSELSFIMPKLF